MKTRDLTVAEFYESYYVPINKFVVIVGPI